MSAQGSIETDGVSVELRPTIATISAYQPDCGAVQPPSPHPKTPVQCHSAYRRTRRSFLKTELRAALPQCLTKRSYSSAYRSP